MSRSDQQPSISVLMSVHNESRWLADALQSIGKQTLAPRELVILDDGSKDSSPFIVKAYACNHPELILCDMAANVGLTLALNCGCDLASGDLIARQDADDLSTPARLESQAPQLSEPDVICATGRSAVMDADGNPAGDRDFPANAADLVESMLSYCTLTHGALMFRRRSWMRYNPMFPYSQDYNLEVSILNSGNIALAQDRIYYYRDHATAITRTKRGEQTTCSLRNGFLHARCLAYAGVCGPLIQSRRENFGRSAHLAQQWTLLRRHFRRKPRHAIHEAKRVARRSPEKGIRTMMKSLLGGSWGLEYILYQCCSLVAVMENRLDRFRGRSSKGVHIEVAKL